MYHSIFRTKERKVVGAILGLAVIIILLIIITSSTRGVKFVEQAVMAENYLNAGSYEQAGEAYKTALTIKGSDQEALTIGLAQAYVGLNNYDKALEILRSGYEKLSSDKIKGKIEEVKAAKTDYEFLQSISRADVYFSNKEYDKAIAEYGKAKLLKSKDVASYQGIAKSYMMQEKYDLAREQILEGIDVTKSKELEAMLESIDNSILKKQYDDMIKQAEEYIYQENYKDGIAQYKQAILLLPAEVAAYDALAQIYIEQGSFNKAIQLLKEALLKIDDNGLKELLDTATQLLEEKKERENMLTGLSVALADRDIDSILTALKTEEFQEKIAADAPVYYGTGEGDISKGTGMVIYNDTTIYYGDFVGGIRKGSGIYFIMTSSENGQGYYYYDGEWNNDIPNGIGETVEMKPLKKDGKIYEDKTVISGSFYNALESGSMKQVHYEDGVEIDQNSYSTDENPEQVQGVKNFVK